MSRIRSQYQLHALAAQRRDLELKRAEEQKKVAQYFKARTNASKHHEQWTTDDYYQKANKDAEKLNAKRLKAVQLEERRKKLELMLFKENSQFQEELKAMESRPKYFRNGSFLNDIPTSTLKDINQGIMDKEESQRRQEAELKLYHAWRLNQPELRAAKTYLDSGKLKSSWLQQIVDKEMEKKKEEEDTRKALKERDEELRKQIQIEEDKLREKEMQMRELRNSLEGQIAELSDKEKEVKTLRKREEREKIILDELQFITSEREREMARLVSERDTTIVNMGLHKYKLKRKVLAVVKEIEMDFVMLQRIRKAVLKDYESDKDKCSSYKQVLDEAVRQLEEHRDREQQRQRTIDAMYDGEARQINQRQEQMWEKERAARAALMSEVVTTLKRQLQERIEQNRQMQKINVLERERILEDMDSYHREVREKENATKLQNTSYSNIAALQSELNSLKLKQDKLEEAVTREADIKAAIENEKLVRREIAKMQRASVFDAPKEAWS